MKVLFLFVLLAVNYVIAISAIIGVLIVALCFLCYSLYRDNVELSVENRILRMERKETIEEERMRLMKEWENKIGIND